MYVQNRKYCCSYKVFWCCDLGHFYEKEKYLVYVDTIYTDHEHNQNPAVFKL